MSVSDNSMEANTVNIEWQIYPSSIHDCFMFARITITAYFMYD